jgi:hypothetical protein
MCGAGGAGNGGDGLASLITGSSVTRAGGGGGVGAGVSSGSGGSGGGGAGVGGQGGSGGTNTGGGGGGGQLMLLQLHAGAGGSGVVYFVCHQVQLFRSNTRFANTVTTLAWPSRRLQSSLHLHASGTLYGVNLCTFFLRKIIL